MKEKYRRGLPFIGALIGGIVAYLLRPSAPLVGQLPFDVVMTRGNNLQGLEKIAIPTAEASFNYIIAGVIIGAILFWIISIQVKE
ncbi:hypothetical protein SAMN04488587_1427 [Methanococcoides vulcani]|uniref:Uncharacterized protein n=1 Tax=Methanococcoides vulcani TaxID=1353158 RepID=A0A1I0A129_9EURY|nr:hypothetical protein [Methanococcoides vulcani]SES87746.1 hypothetical protein SAMN04488587_1427 [Methanococcoides vulcani]